MERLTEYVTENCSKPFYRFRSDGEIYIRYRYCINIEKAIDKLAEYENTGLQPNEVEELKQTITDLNDEIEQLHIGLNTEHNDKHICASDCLKLREENEQLKQQLAEKDKQLENAIVPKFKIGQEVWVVWTDGVLKNMIHNFTVDGYAQNNWQGENNKAKDNELLIYFNADNKPIAEEQRHCFATKQEAEEALKKLNKE